MQTRKEIVATLKLALGELDAGRKIYYYGKEDRQYVYATIVELGKVDLYESVFSLIAKCPSLPKFIALGKTFVEFAAQNPMAKINKEQFELVSKVLRGIR